MDPNAVVLEISSDEDVALDDYDCRGIPNDHDQWIAKLLYDINRDHRHYDDAADDSDEVVVVSEVLPSKKPRKKFTSKSSPLIDVDDDCVVLDHDPDKPMEVQNHNPIDRHEEDDDDSDDLLVVSEKGQVACRDYPHPRHLCIKFPFSSTPNESHCDQCYCYVCDSLAPCVYWGNGSATMDHCHATEKDEFWKLERQNSKNGNKGVGVQPLPIVADTSLSNQLPPMDLLPPAPVFVQTPSVAHNQVPRPPIRTCPVSSSFGVPSIINQNRSSFLLARNKYHPDLVSQQLIRTSSCTNPRDRQQHNYNLGTPFQKPIFKRTVSTGVSLIANRYSYSSYRDDCINPDQRQDYLVNEMLSGSSQPHVVNTSGSFPPPNLTFEEPLPSLPEFSHLPNSNASFDFSPNYQPQLNLNSYVETPVLFQPHSVSLSSQPQRQASLSNYSIPTEPFQQQNEVQRSTIDPKFFHDISWPQSAATQSSVHQGTAPANDSSLAMVSGGAVDYPYNDWTYDDQACMDIPGSFELNESSPGPAYIDTENDGRHWC